MEKLNTEDGQLFIKNLASFVRTHEKALANALQLSRQPSKNAQPGSPTVASPTSSTFSSTSTLAAALSFGALNFTSHNIKPAKLTLTPHHLFYLLSRFEDLSIAVGPMSVRLENIHTEASPAYVSFLSRPQRSRTDKDSIHSVSSVRSVMSGMSSLWSSIGLGKESASKSEKAKAAIEADLKYLYSSFTKIPCLRLAPDHRARLISGYEEFPFDTAVPLHSFKNLSALEIIDIDFRSFFGWDRISEQLRTLTVKRANLDDPADLLTGIVLDDIDKRRRRSSKSQPSPVLGWSANATPQPVQGSEFFHSTSAPGSPITGNSFGAGSSPQGSPRARGCSDGMRTHNRTGSISPTRPSSSKYRHARGSSTKIRRKGSGSSNSSENSMGQRNSSTQSLLVAGFLPPSKWRFLRHLCLADNSLTTIGPAGLAPVANTLHSLDLSSNLFAEVPDSLASLVSLRALNLSNCMIDSLHSLSRNPLPAITALNLRGNRLRSIAGIERLLSLERLDLRDNNLTDPTEIARLTGIPYIREIWVSGNPFTKTHSNYRVTIFNLFRRTPGYSEDIIINSSGPGYSERKQLVSRAAEPESAPVVRPIEPDNIVTVDKGAHTVLAPPDLVYPEIDPEKRTVPVTVQSQYAVGSSRRKKGPRRKIVDISREESSSIRKVMESEDTDSMSRSDIVGSFTDTEFPGDMSPKSECEPLTQTTTIESVATQRAPQLDKPDHVIPNIKGMDLNGGGDAYRQRLEALKNEVGSGWLTVLGDEVWDNKVNKDVSIAHVRPNLDAPITIRPSPVQRTSSQVLATGGRTLGG
ncbi:hypothetical protein FQN54_008171 [Arachnomyces sp. PD_36]|nr:hypothetical protein FQN54_008171 [Arachnomyces sp. PD_36]